MTGAARSPFRTLEIEDLHRALASRARLEPLLFVKAGDRVPVCHGPLAGLEGVLLAKKDGLRVVISVELLARSVAVEIDGSYLAQS